MNLLVFLLGIAVGIVALWIWDHIEEEEDW